MLFARLVTGLILVPVVILAILYLPSPYIAAFSGIFFLIGAFEWSTFMGLKKISSKFISASLFVLITTLIFYLIISQIITLFSVLYVATAWWLLALVLIFIYPRSSSLLSIKLVSFIAGILSIIPAWLAVVYTHDSIVLGPQWLVLLLLVIWAADIGAYFAGKLLGKHKLAPKVSPGKTWEGLIGGFILSLTVAYVAFKFSFVTGLSLERLLLLVAITTLFTIVGDLSESAFKRVVGVKDSGKILPGHGGVLDRIDSMLAAAPVFLVAFVLLR